jgi:DNA-binding response OmpR family regulator
MNTKILIAEDDRDISEIIEIYLIGEGYDLKTVRNGIEGLNAVNEENFDLAILDIMMPEMDGYKLTREIRKISNMPIIILSAKNEDQDKILGLNIGADDYITKPFNPLELIARVNSHLRRNRKYNDSDKHVSKILSLKNLRLDTETCRLYKDDTELLITATEYKMMSLFMKNPDKIFSKIQLAEHILGEYFESDSHTIRVHISKLRHKLGVDKNGNQYIQTMKGLGYRIENEKQI